MHVGGATTASDDHRAHVAPSHLWLYVDQGQRADSIRIRHLQGTVEEVSFKLLVFQLLLSYTYSLFQSELQLQLPIFYFSYHQLQLLLFQLHLSYQPHFSYSYS